MGRFKVETSGLERRKQRLDAPTTGIVSQGTLRTRVGQQNQQLAIARAGGNHVKPTLEDPSPLGENLDLTGRQALKQV